MARSKGLLPFSGNFEPQVAGPFDARTVVGTVAELVLAATWTAKDGNFYSPVGLQVLVNNDTEANNGTYFLPVGKDYTVAGDWVKDGGGTAVLPDNVVTYNGLEPVNVGDSFGGGTVTYVRDNGDGTENIYVLDIASIASKSWSPDIAGIPTVGFINGRLNTEAIAAYYGDGDYAAKYCIGLTTGGYSDWYLPLITELSSYVLPYLIAHSLFTGGGWSSNIDDNSTLKATACGYDGVSNFLYYPYRTSSQKVYPIRKITRSTSSGTVEDEEIAVFSGTTGKIIKGGGKKISEISAGTGGGDMLKATYDTNNNGKVDTAENAEKLGGTLADQFVQTNDSRLSDARPASDVSTWAKAPFKPEYTAGEVGAQPTEAGKGLSTNDYTTAEKNKLASIDATHYGAPLQSAAELAALTDYTDKQRHYVEDQLSDYFYDAQATSGDIAPANQVGGIGWWRKVAVGGETAASIKTKYESNPDTNAYTNDEKSKLASITAIFTTALKSAYDAAYQHSQSAHAPAGAQVNVIESMKIDGKVVPITSKELEISVDDSVAVTLANGVMTVAISDAYKKKITLAQFM